MRRAYADTPEGQVHYRTEGDGEPVLLLHAAVTSSAEYEIPDHAQTVVSFMDSLGIGKAHIVGQFNGAMVATEIAVRWPERVNKLVLGGTGFWEKTEADALDEPTGFTSRNELRPDGSHLLEWWHRANSFGDRPLEIAEERVLEYIKAGPRGEEMHWAGAVYDLKPRLPLIACPTLVLDATHFLFHYLAEEVKDLIPNAKLTVIENGPMFVTRAMPREYAEAVLTFLDSPDT